jgi:hypothetical protein
MIERTLFSPDHEAFRDSFRRFIDKEIAPLPRGLGRAGLRGPRGLEQGRRERLSLRHHARGLWRRRRRQAVFGGAVRGAVARWRHRHRLQPAQRDRRALHPALRHRGAEAEVPAQTGHRRDDRRHRHERAGRGLGPAGHQVHALQQADGSYLLNGSKTFITNGWHADLVIVVAKTNPAAGGKGTSLLLVERGMPGFSVGKRLKKLGLRAQDTSELFFDNVRVPAENLLGGAAMENRGFICLMEQLPWERLQIAITAVAAAQSRHRPDGGLCEGAQGVRPGGGRVPEHPLHPGRAADRGAGGARVRGQVLRTGLPGQARHRHRQHGQVLVSATCNAR